MSIEISPGDIVEVRVSPALDWDLSGVIQIMSKKELPTTLTVKEKYSFKSNNNQHFSFEEIEQPGVMFG